MEGVVAHEYPDIQATVEKQVRAELSIVGREGSCGCVRDLTLTPGSGPGWAGGGSIEVSIDEGTTLESGSSFSVRAKVSNPTTGTVSVHVLFDTPDKSTITDASGEGCQVVDADTVECDLSLKGASGSSASSATGLPSSRRPSRSRVRPAWSPASSTRSCRIELPSSPERELTGSTRP